MTEHDLTPRPDAMQPQPQKQDIVSIARTELIPAKRAMTLTDLADAMNRLMGSTRSKATQRAFRDDLKAFWSVKDLKDVSPEMVLHVTTIDIFRYVERLEGYGLASATIRRKVASIKKFYRMLVIGKVIEESPVNSLVKLPPLSKDQMPTPVLSKREVDQIFAVPNRQTWTGARNYCIMCFAYYFGLRREEIHRIQVQDIHIADSGALAFYVQTKGEKRRFCEFTSTVEEALKQWLAKRGKDDGSLITNEEGGALSERQIWEVVHKSALKAGDNIQRRLPGPTKHGHWRVHPHTFRATMITKMHNEGVPIGKISLFVDHADSSTTLRYTRGQEIDRVEMGDVLNRPDPPKARHKPRTDRPIGPAV